MYFYFYQVFMILSMAISLYLITLIWRRRHLPAANAMIALFCATFVWTLGFFLEANSGTLDRQLLFNNIGYLGSMAVPPAWFVFASNYTNSIKFMRGRRLAYICVIPLVITILIWTNNWHHLMWSNAHLAASGAFTVTVKTYGPVFWVALAYNYLLILAGSIILLRRLFVGTPLYTKQAVSLLIGVCLPWVWNIIYVFNLIPMPRKDLTPVMFTISGLAVALGLVRYHLFTTVPFAREFIVRQLNDGIFILDVRNNLVEANPAALKIAGADEQIIGKKLEDLLPLSALFKHFGDSSIRRQELALEIGGEKRYFELEITPMTIQKDHPAGRLVILHDMTERKKSEEQYRLIAENSADIIYKVNLKTGAFTFTSLSVSKVLGYTEKEALSLTIKDVITPDSFEKQQNQMAKDLQAGNLQSTLELNAIHKDGRIIPVEVHASLICDEKGTPVEFVGVARDITERKKMENQLVMQDRLAAIGQLASGVAHELNNPLTAIINYSTLLLKRELPEDIQQDVKEINEEALRTAIIVKNLLTFAGKQRLDKELINIIQSIQKVLELRAYEQRVNNIRTTVRANTELPMVLGNSSRIQQVFFNIIINAEFFMTQAHKKGNLVITAEKTGDMVRIAFADDGPGIPKDDINNIFTPFFTTKDIGKGTGLSLSICLSIINEHGGKIWVESEPGRGTTFFIELPVYRQDERDENS